MRQTSPKTKLISLLWVLVSLIWMLPLGAYFLNSWEADLSPVERTYSAREQSCNAAYSDPEARERCLNIMRLERFQSHSIMIANRALACAVPPLIGFALLVYLRRRQSTVRTSVRSSAGRSSGKRPSGKGKST